MLCQVTLKRWFLNAPSSAKAAVGPLSSLAQQAPGAVPLLFIVPSPKAVACHWNTSWCRAKFQFVYQEGVDSWGRVGNKHRFFFVFPYNQL